MSAPPHSDLSRRERQIMDVIHRHGQATVAEVVSEIPDEPSYSAIRSALRLLREKGIVETRQDGRRYMYLPSVPVREARRSALRHLIRTFFDGDGLQVVDAILDLPDTQLPEDELRRLADMIEQARARDEQS